MTGTLYGVGVGPGDPELITLKAVRVIQECPVLAVPQTGQSRQVALSIVQQAVPGLEEKQILSLAFPMIKDHDQLEQNRDRIAGQIREVLLTGKDVAFLTLGDPGIYSTYWYIHQRILAEHLPAEIIAGVPSFCAAAAKLHVALAEADQPIHVIPASYPDTEAALSLKGTKVLMKMGRQLDPVKTMLNERGILSGAMLVQNCGMEQEVVCRDLQKACANDSYFSIIVLKEDSR